MNSGFIKLVLVMVALAMAGCFMRDLRWQSIRPPSGAKAKLYRLETTAYCPCRQCCGWKRNWYGKVVVAYGPNRGKAKTVGQTASGVMARNGTIAADTSIFPFGTIMYIPGYGYGVVEDRGGDIKGYHIDLYYPSHATALKWGRVQKEVKVWFPDRSAR